MNHGFSTAPAGYEIDPQSGKFVQTAGSGTPNHTFSPAPVAPSYQPSGFPVPFLAPQAIQPQAPDYYDSPIVGGGYFNPPARQSELQKIVIIAVFAVIGAVIGILIQQAIRGVRALARKTGQRKARPRVTHFTPDGRIHPGPVSSCRKCANY